MNRANHAELRIAIEAANLMMKAGILFVPMPALNQDDAVELMAQSVCRLDMLADRAELDDEDKTK